MSGDRIQRRTPVGVIGLGTMGRGIAQVAAQHGHEVLLYDVSADAVRDAPAQIRSGVDRGWRSGRWEVSGSEVSLTPCADLGFFRRAGIVIECVIEALDVKAEVLRRVESVMDDDAIIATNTSALSPTRLAAQLEHPERFVGLHFFNPAPLMRLVEVVSAHQTAPETTRQAASLARAWGKEPVISAPTPGFIVNRVARAYYAEAWELLESGAADAATADWICREAGGFPMGPFELMDLIGQDVNEAVTRAVWTEMGFDRRFAPSLLQRRYIEAGQLGRKSGTGVVHGVAGEAQLTSTDGPAPAVAGWDAELGTILRRAGLDAPEAPAPGPVRTAGGLVLVRSDGRSANVVSAEGRVPVAVIDRSLDDAAVSGLVVSFSVTASAAQHAELAALLGAAGIRMTVVRDRPGAVVARTVAAMVNLALDAFTRQVASVTEIDTALKLGAGYPLGPFEWATRWGWPAIATILANVRSATGDDRYRPALYLDELGRECVTIEEIGDGLNAAL